MSRESSRQMTSSIANPDRSEIAQALLVANVRAMTPALARQSLDVLLDRSGGFFEDVRLDAAGMATVLKRTNWAH